MPPKKVMAKTDWTISVRPYVDSTIFGETSKTYISGLSEPSGTFTTIGPEIDPEKEPQYHDITISSRKGTLPVAIFMDYLKLKGVTSMNIDMAPGEPLRLRLDMFIGKVISVEPEDE